MKTKLLLLLAASLTGCVDLDPVGSGGSSGPPRTLAERHGTPIGDTWEESMLSWSAVTNEVAYLNSNSTIAYARHMTTGGRRVIHTASGGLMHVGIGDAGSAFTVEAGPTGHVLRMHTGTTSEVLTSNAFIDANAPNGAVPVLQSASGEIAYLMNPRELHLRQGDGVTRRVAGNCASLSSWSATGNEVVCINLFTAEELRRISLANGETTVIGTESRMPIATRWTSAGLYMLGWSAQSLVLTIPGAPPRMSMAELFGEMIRGDAAISPDGSTFAYFSSHCAIGDILSCTLQQYMLHVVDVATGQRRRIAVHSSPQNERNGAIAFSPDGSRIAYIFHRTLYLITI